MQKDTRLDGLEDKRRLSHWGKTTKDDCEVVEACYRHTRDDVNEAREGFR